MFLQAQIRTFALPLIALPGISPRIVTGRKTLSSPISPITDVFSFQKQRAALSYCR